VYDGCGQKNDPAHRVVVSGFFLCMNDPIYHPKHYTEHPSGVECVTIAEAFNFNLGNCIKYIWRAGLKTEDPVEDLKKAAWYIKREIEKIQRERGQ
jgi:hypothetical protein